MRVSRAALVEAAQRSDLALAFEAAIGDTATVARRGVLDWRITVSAKTGHSSGVLDPSVGDGAIFEMARILHQIRNQVAENGVTINPSVVLGGTKIDYDASGKQGRAEGKTNVISARAVVEGDLRFLTAAQLERARARLQSIAARNSPHASATIEFSEEYPAMSPNPGNYAILRVLDQGSRALGMAPVTALDPLERGAGDISFVAPYIDGLDGLGARGSHSHTIDEEVDLESFPGQIKHAAILIYRLTR
jgi:glutamate carboxypeptidase